MKPEKLPQVNSGNFLSRYIILILIGLYVVAVAAVFLQQQRLYRSIRISSARHEARRHVEALDGFRTLYTAKVVAAAQDHGMRVTHDYQQYEHGAIPLPATLSMELGEVLSRQGSGDTKLYSPYPFPWREADGGLRDSFAEDAWQALREQPDKPFHRIEQHDGQEVLRYAIADRMRKSCVECHNTHVDSPRTDWKVGDVRGVLEVTTPIHFAAGDAKRALTESSVAAMALGGIAFLALTITINHFRKTSVQLKTQCSILKHYSEELERHNTDLDEFVYVASHDLRAPLRAIQHLAEWISEDAQEGLPSKSAERLSRIQKLTNQLDRMLADLLIYFRAGRTHGQVEQVHTRKLIQDIVDMFDVPDTFKISVPEDDIVLTTLKTPLELCLRNLVSNAIKHHDRHDGCVVVTAAVKGKFIEFTVEDDGPGIDPKHHERIFKMFQTLQSRDKVDSSGIGLAIIKKTVESCSSTISVESSPGQGSTFRLRWPRVTKVQQPKCSR